MDPVIGGIVSGVVNTGTSLGSGILGTATQAWQNKVNRDFEAEQAALQRDWNEEMFNKTNTWNYEMWNKTNEYNSPTEQIKRLEEAGLNPLYYNLDGTSANNVQSAAALGYDRASLGQMINPVSTGLDAAIKVAQISNIQANTAKQNNETQTETAKREKLLAEIENTKQELENLKAQEGLTDAQRAEIEKGLEWMDRLNQATLDAKNAEAALNESQKKRIDTLLEGEKILQTKNIKDFDERWKKIDAEIKKMAKETGLLEKDIENYAINHMQSGWMGTGLSIPNIVRGTKLQFGKKKPSYSSDMGTGGGER